MIGSWCAHQEETIVLLLLFLFSLNSLHSWWWLECPQELVIIVNYSVCAVFVGFCLGALCAHILRILQWDCLSWRALTYGLPNPTFNYWLDAYEMLTLFYPRVNACRLVQIACTLWNKPWGIADNLKTLQIH